MNILDIVVTVLIIVASVLFSTKKNSKKTPSYEPYDEEENSEWNESSDAPEWETILQKTAKNVPNSYFDDDFGKIEKEEKKTQKEELISMQDIELEEEKESPFLISQEEMRRAVIYAEILKTPYFEKITN